MTDQRIPMDQMEPRRVYRLQSRNLLAGVWNPETRGFIGIRRKFDSEYLFTEYHYEVDPRIGTASPLEALDMLPENIELKEYDRSGPTLVMNQPLFDFLEPPTRELQRQLGLESQARRLEAESNRYRPQTKAEAEQEERIAAAREWMRQMREAGDLSWREITAGMQERLRAPEEGA